MTLADGQTLQADLVVAANGVHSTTRSHVVSKDEDRARDTGWASMRWLIPTEELLADPKTAPQIGTSSMPIV